MNSEDQRTLKHARKSLKSGKIKKIVIAKKRGGNARGAGADRSVLLATSNNVDWYQYYKFWGERNEQRAEEFISSLKKEV